MLHERLRRALTVLPRPDSTRTLADLPASLVEQTGRKVLAQFGPGRPLTEADLRYLLHTHGLPPELVTELMD
jgi:hypothetical protein